MGFFVSGDQKKELQIKMSSVTPLTFHAVELCVVTINEKPWTRARKVCRALKYNKKTVNIVKNHCSKENYTQKYQLSSAHAACTPISWPKHSQKYDTCINEKGMIELLVGSQQPLEKELAEYEGIKIIGHKYVCKKAETIYTIQKVFEGISMKWHFSIGSYRIDLYFPENKLATECDEHDHKDRDINYEIRRQKFIEDQLNCKFIFYNHDAKDFTIESVLNKIFQYIYQKLSL